MSLFGTFLGDVEEDPFFGSHMRTMRQMNNMMNSLFADPFGMMGGMGDFENRSLSMRNLHNSMIPFGMPMMPNFNRLLSNSLSDLDNIGSGHIGGGHIGGGHSYSSTSVVSMTSGPDGRPQVYKATSSTRTAPGGIKETQRTVTDSLSGTKKMAVGHHIGARAHIVEKEQNIHTGDREERQDFINLEEDEAEDFNREWELKARNRSEIPRITSATSRNRHSYGGHSSVPAITAGSSSRRHRDRHASPLVSARRSIRSSPLLALPPAVPASSSSGVASRTPYSPPSAPQPRKSKNVKTVSGTPPPPQDM